MTGNCSNSGISPGWRPTANRAPSFPHRPDGGTLLTKEFEAYEAVLEADVKTKGKKCNASEPQAYFRYIRSITIPPMPAAHGGPTTNNPNLPCLLCHGVDTRVSQEVKDKIAEFYPHNQAMG